MFKISLLRMNPIVIGTYVLVPLLLIEVNVAQHNISGSQDPAMFWLKLSFVTLACLFSLVYAIRNRSVYRKMLVSIAFPMLVYFIATFISNNFGGMGSS